MHHDPVAYDRGVSVKGRGEDVPTCGEIMKTVLAVWTGRDSLRLIGPVRRDEDATNRPALLVGDEAGNMSTGALRGHEGGACKTANDGGQQTEDSGHDAASITRIDPRDRRLLTDCGIY